MTNIIAFFIIGGCGILGILFSFLIIPKSRLGN